jgi:hypothetical protein
MEVQVPERGTKLNDFYVSVCEYKSTKRGYLVLAGVCRGVPGDQVAIPKIKL